MRFDRWPLLAALPVAVVAIAAGWQSYTHISQLATMTGQPVTDARLLPVVVDGLIVAGSVILLAGGKSSWLGWLAVVPGIAATVFGNVMSAADRGPLAAAVASWPAAAFIIASFVLERWLAARSAAAVVDELGAAVVGELEHQGAAVVDDRAAAVVDELGAAATPRAVVSALVSAGIRETTELAQITGTSERHARRLRKQVDQHGDAAAAMSGHPAAVADLEGHRRRGAELGAYARPLVPADV